MSRIYSSYNSFRARTLHRSTTDLCNSWITALEILIVFVVTYLSQCVSLRTIEVIIPCCANNIQYSQMESTRYRLVTKLQTVQLFPSSYMTWSLDYLVTDPQFVQLFPSSYVTAYHRVFSRKNYNEGLHWNYMSFFVTHLINACRCRQSG
jgi:NADH:ubiquinone oxidoreductase subunit 3 (subunit A)